MLQRGIELNAEEIVWFHAFNYTIYLGANAIAGTALTLGFVRYSIRY